MILDATAGNRTMWETKQCNSIIYIDMEKELERKPTIFADNTRTPFLSKTFNCIFYDPPHLWGVKNRIHARPNLQEQQKVYPQLRHTAPYYGWDKYNSKSALINHLNSASKEFYRILADDGLLWLKWNEVSMPIRTIEVIFRQWIVMIRLFVHDPQQTAGIAQTYWLCFTKEKGEMEQLTLLDSRLSEDSPQPTL